MQVDVLAHQGHLHAVAGVVHAVEQPVPLGPVHVPEGQGEALDEERVQPLAVQGRRHLVDAGGVLALDDRGGVDVAHEGDLALDALGQGPVGAQHQGVGLDANAAQRRHRVLGGLGLELAGRAQEGDERDVHEGHVLPSQVGAHLAGGLQEGLGLDVAHRAADLGDDDVGRAAPGAGGGLSPHDALDLVGDVRNDLDGVPEVLPAPLLGNDGGVDLPGGGVGGAGEVNVQEALVVADVQIGLGAVLGDEDLPVLERVHGAGVDVDVGVELLHDHVQAPGPQQPAQAGGRQPLSQRGDDAPGDEDVPGGVGRASTRTRAVGAHGPPTKQVRRLGRCARTAPAPVTPLPGRPR